MDNNLRVDYEVITQEILMNLTFIITWPYMYFRQSKLDFFSVWPEKFSLIKYSSGFSKKIYMKNFNHNVVYLCNDS